MSRSVSAPSSVTKTSPCWNGLIVPGSTLLYGSNFWTETLRPRAFSSRPSEAAVMPLPSEETTPPVTKTYFVGRALMSTPLACRRDPFTAWYGRRRTAASQRRGRLAEVVQPCERAARERPAQRDEQRA